MAVFRVYVEKKRDYRIEAENLAKEIRDFLKIPGLMDLRIINRYDIEGIDDVLFERSKDLILSSHRTDEIYDRLPEADYVIAAESLPGQFDQRADSTAQAIQLISKEDPPVVRTAKIILLSGKLSAGDIESIENYIINPIESRKAQLQPYESLVKREEEPKAVEIMEGFINMSHEESEEFLENHNLAMDIDDLLFCRDYFKSEGRNPSYTEIKMIDTYWSDHCRHTTFLTEIDSVTIEDENVEKSFNAYLDMRSALSRKDKPITLMDMATIGARYLKHTGELNTLDESEEVNACSVKVDVDVDGIKQPWLLMFKNETHNHPTEIEPFGGASTCLGGAIRDPLSGRSYVYQAMRITGAADPLAPIDATIEGKLPQRKLVKQAAKGYSSYGNQIGLAAGIVNEIYHPGYAAKRMEMGAVLAAAPADNVVRSVPIPGDVVILLGGKTGRDGCGGATGSSKSHDSSSLEKGGAEVQKGNAPEERKIQRLFRKSELARMIKRCNDFGAGGVSVAVGELADSLEINLDTVPVKYEGLDGTELAISESQERMAVVVAKEDAKTFIEYAHDENLHATPIAEVTDSRRLIMKWRGEKIVDISREFLNSNGVAKHIKIKVPALKAVAQDGGLNGEADGNLKDITHAITDLLSDLNICSQKGLANIFDSTAGASTVSMPFGGMYQETPVQAMVAKLPVLKGDTSTCSAASWGFNPYVTEINPYKGSYYAVIESVAKLVAVGGDLKNCWLSFQEFFEKLGDDPERWGKPFSALLGALDAQRDLSIAAIGGKDSMSGSFEDLDVPPTLVSVAVSLCDANTVISPEFKEAGNRVLLISPKYGEDELPLRDSLVDCFNEVSRLIKEGKIVSAYAITGGGVAEAIFKMSLGNRVGLDIEPHFNIKRIFDGRPGAFVVEWKNSKDSDGNHMPGEVLGRTINDFAFIQGSEKISLEDLRDSYNGRLEEVFPTVVTGGDHEESKAAKIPDACLEIEEKGKKSFTSGFAKTSGKPSVLIPVFPGSGGEYEAAKMIENAGGRAEVVVFNNLSSKGVKESFTMLAKRIKSSQIILLSGGMPFGDEPDGGGKAVAAILKEPELADAIHEFLETHQGLMLGLGDGFKALLKTGLLPYGRITDLKEGDPDIAINSIGLHQSAIVNTKICSNVSPWLQNTGVGDVYPVPISCFEGRFSASEDMITELRQNGQVAAQYVDLKGKPTMDIRFNPGGSAMAIESITSPDGRILGRMGQFERLGRYLYKNVPGIKEYNIFKSAIDCYK